MTQPRTVSGATTRVVWVVGLVCVVVGFGAVAGVGGVLEGEPDPERAPVYVEQFRVAEPLGENPEMAIRERLETITAVTEPYDEVEAAAEDQRREALVADNPAELRRQCVTVLKEIAFCSGETTFLESIGGADSLQDTERRELFLRRVDDWFEPGAARRYCNGLFAGEALGAPDQWVHWGVAAQAAGGRCPAFGERLMETEVFEVLSVFWQPEQRVISGED